MNTVLKESVPEVINNKLSSSHQKNKSQGSSSKSVSKRESCVYCIDDEQLNATLRGISQNILIKMDQLGLTATNLEKISGIAKSNISHYCRGDKSMNMRTFVRIASALEVAPVELFPYDSNLRKSNGSRFEELTSGLSVESVNSILEIVACVARIENNLKKQR